MTGEITLRPMTVADLDAILPAERQLFGAEAWSRSSYLDELSDTDTRYYLVAVAGDSVSAGVTPTEEVLGDAGLLTVGETAEVLTIGVLPAAQRRGVGRTLLRALLAEARRRSATEVLLEVRIDNEPARTLYETEGFTVLGVRRGYYDRGRVDAVTMRYEL